MHLDDVDWRTDGQAALKCVGEQLRAAIYGLRLNGEQRTPLPHLLESLVAVHRAIAVDPEIELDLRGGIPAGPLAQPAPKRCGPWAKR